MFCLSNQHMKVDVLSPSSNMQKISLCKFHINPLPHTIMPLSSATTSRLLHAPKPNIARRLPHPSLLSLHTTKSPY